MSKKNKPRRPALERRKREKAARKLALDKNRLAALEPGGCADRPLTVESAAIVEQRARSPGCHQCEGPLVVEDHSVVNHEAQLLRAVDLQCRRCHTRRRLWIRVQPVLPS